MSLLPPHAWHACGGAAQAIEVLDVRRGYVRVCRCSGHSSTVTHLDWAADSGAIVSNDQAYEVGGFASRAMQRQMPFAWTGMYADTQ